MYVYGGRTQDRVLSDLYALDFSQSPLRWRCIGTANDCTCKLLIAPVGS